VNEAMRTRAVMREVLLGMASDMPPSGMCVLFTMTVDAGGLVYGGGVGGDEGDA
jgi:hypothetical protein